MIRFQEKKVQRVQLNEISMEFLCEFYSSENQYNTVLIIYDRGKYLTNISLEEVFKYSEEKELICFLKYLCRGKELNSSENVSEEAELIFKGNPDFVWILVRDTCKADKALFISNYVTDIEKYSKVMVSVRDLLRSKGIWTFLVRVPVCEDILEEKRHPEWKLFNFSTKMNWSAPRRKKMQEYLYKFTDLEYDAARKDMCEKLIKDIKIGNGKRTIFLVGPCIVGGGENCSGETLAEILYNRLVGCLAEYQVERVITNIDIKSKFAAILEKDINQNDIVIWIDSYIKKDVPVDLELTDIYNHYDGDKWLYSDMPIHTTKAGNEIIADALISNIINPTMFSISQEKNDQVVAHEGEKQLTCEEEDLIYEHLSKVKACVKDSKGNNGACVMTCNPFTKGHYYLIECASKMVDFLYVFVVEEDAFYFSFEDRFEMVRKGTIGLSNVTVLPSGRFMISRETFKSYFEKEILQDAVIDAAKDIMIFKNYVVPILGISKRFVGSEPEDHITAQYNQALKDSLNDLVEIIEIPRKVERGEIVSASKVRKYLNEENWQRVEQFVPYTTLEYIKKNLKKVINKGNRNKLSENIVRIIRFVEEHQNIVICGLGEDAKRMMNQLAQNMDVKDIEKLNYYDRKIAQRNGTYRGKKVIGFQELISQYKDYYMVIATSKFKMDLLYDLAENEIDPEHIIFL